MLYSNYLLYIYYTYIYINKTDSFSSSSAYTKKYYFFLSFFYITFLSLFLCL